VSSTAASGTASLSRIASLLDHRFDPSTAEDWDQVGLVSGDVEQPIRKVLFAVDPLPAVVEDGAARGFDLLVTHHPLLLRGVHSAANNTAKGRMLRELIKSDLALVCAHTNADSAVAGVNDALASAAGIVRGRPIQPIPDREMSKLVVHTPAESVDLVRAALFEAGAGRMGSYDSCAYSVTESGQFRPLVGANPHVGDIGLLQQDAGYRLETVIETGKVEQALAAVRLSHPYESPAIDVIDLVDPPGIRGLGRWGNLDSPTTVLGLAERLATALPATHHGIRVSGLLETEVTAAAVCGGAGDSLLGDVRRKPVQAYVTSDLRHHPATDHLAASGCALLDIAHFAGEWLWLQWAADQLVADAAESGYEVSTEVSTINTDPWSAHVVSRK
jgi:dinuclear metal center YbgI/SA1388 family protein